MGVHDENGLATREYRPRGDTRAGQTDRGRQALICTGHCYLFLEELRARGIDPQPALVAAGLSTADVRLDALMSEARFLTFLAGVEALAADPDLGLYAGQRLELQAMDLLGMLLRSSKNGKDACDTYRRYGDIWGAARDADMHISATEIRVRHRALASCAATPRLLVDMVLSRVLKAARFVRKSATPCRVTFTYPEPADLGAYRRLFLGAELEFDAPSNDLIFPGAHHLEEPLAHHDPALWSVLEPHVARAASNANPAPSDTVTLVRNLLIRQLASKLLSVGQVAEALQRSERSLRRQLRELGTSYHDLLAEVRKEKALAHRAAHPHDSGVQLSEQLGFSEPAVFYRAFKRWTGFSWSSAEK